MSASEPTSFLDNQGTRWTVFIDGDAMTRLLWATVEYGIDGADGFLRIVERARGGDLEAAGGLVAVALRPQIEKARLTAFEFGERLQGVEPEASRALMNAFEAWTLANRHRRRGEAFDNLN